MSECLRICPARRLERCRLDNSSGVATTAEVLQAVVDAVHEVLQNRTWAHAFAENGLLAGQRGVRASLLEKLQLVEAPDVGEALPSLQQLQHSFGERRRIPLGWIFKGSLISRGVASPMIRLGEDTTAEGSSWRRAWEGRLRTRGATPGSEPAVVRERGTPDERPARAAASSHGGEFQSVDSQTVGGRTPRGRRLPWMRTIMID